MDFIRDHGYYQQTGRIGADARLSRNCRVEGCPPKQMFLGTVVRIYIVLECQWIPPNHGRPRLKVQNLQDVCKWVGECGLSSILILEIQKMPQTTHRG